MINSSPSDSLNSKKKSINKQNVTDIVSNLRAYFTFYNHKQFYQSLDYQTRDSIKHGTDVYQLVKQLFSDGCVLSLFLLKFVLIFGTTIVAVTILDHITQEEGRKVATSIINALEPGGFVFIETFTIHDPGAKLSQEEGKAISETASFVQYYFQEGELADWFSQLETVRYEEIMKYDDSHGEPHYHGLARLIARKPIA